MLGFIKVTITAISIQIFIFMLKTASSEGRILLYEPYNLICDHRPKYPWDSVKGSELMLCLQILQGNFGSNALSLQVKIYSCLTIPPIQWYLPFSPLSPENWPFLNLVMYFAFKSTLMNINFLLVKICLWYLHPFIFNLFSPLFFRFITCSGTTSVFLMTNFVQLHLLWLSVW